jgi:hypothetical protein
LPPVEAKEKAPTGGAAVPAAAAKNIDWPLWWFLRLEAAVERGDHVAAAEAQRELERLGVHVRYGHPRRQSVTAEGGRGDSR